MPMTDEEFESALNKLGLNTPPQMSSMADANASYHPESAPKNWDYLNSGKENEAYQSAQGKELELPEPTPVPQSSKTPAQPQEEAPAEEPQQAAPQPIQPVAPVQSPQPSVQENPMDNPEINDAALKQAQSNTDLKRLGLGIGEGFTRLAATAGGGKFDDAQFREMNKNADSGVTDIKDRRDAVTKKMMLANTLVETATKNLSLDRARRLTDANSMESKAIRDMVTKYEPKLANDPSFQSMSGQDVKDFMLHFLEAEGRNEATKANKQLSHEMQEKRLEETHAKDLDQHQKNYQKIMSPDAGGFSNEVRKQIDLHVSADRAQKVLDQYKDPKTGQYNIPPERFGDLNLSVVNLLTNGKSSVHALKQITPNNVELEAGKIIQWFTGDPHGVEQTKWLQDYQGLLDREDSISKEYVKDYYDKQYDAAKRARKGEFYQTDPEYYDNFYKSSIAKYAKSDKDIAKEKGGMPGHNDQGQKFDKDVLSYAEKHGISPQQALSIKQQRQGAK